MSHFVSTTKKSGLLPSLDSPQGVGDGDTLFQGIRPVDHAGQCLFQLLGISVFGDNV